MWLALNIASRHTYSGTSDNQIALSPKTPWLRTCDQIRHSRFLGVICDTKTVIEMIPMSTEFKTFLRGHTIQLIALAHMNWKDMRQNWMDNIRWRRSTSQFIHFESKLCHGLTVGVFTHCIGLIFLNMDDLISANFSPLNKVSRLSTFSWVSFSRIRNRPWIGSCPVRQVQAFW